MKTMIKLSSFVLATLALTTIILRPSTARAAVSLNITPNAVSNTYGGQITLAISGLTTGGSVVVQKYLDVNTNGVIDGNDQLVQQFSMTDGQAGMVIGGVTNFNVPGDTDGTANGTITAKLNFQNGDILESLSGNFLYKVSGNFTPVTNAFTVTNFPFAQKFTGNVVSNGTSTTLPNSIVLLFPPPQAGQNGPGSPLGGVVANNAGSYTVALPPGTYTLVAFHNNYLANTTLSPVLTLGSGVTITTNLTVTNSTSTISGSVVDAANTNIGLPGLLMPVQNKNGMLGVSFTDTNGNFTVGVQSGTWKLGGNDVSFTSHGYMGVQNKISTNAGVSGVIIALTKATALIYGSVKDNLGNPLPALDVYANENNNLYQTDAYTDPNGNYVLGVVGFGTSDYWYMQANDNQQLTNYVFSQETISGYITNGTAVLQNFTAILATNHITGNVQSSGTNIVGVGVSANANLGGVNYQTQADTDSSGNYSLNVPNGSWNVSLNCNGGNNSLDNILGVGNYVCPNNQTANIANNNSTNNFNVLPCGGVSILTTSLPVGEVGVYYNQYLQASSCSPSFTWVFTTSPPGWLNLNTSGNLFGTPTSAGSSGFTVQVTDGNSHSTTQGLTLVISNAVQITTTSLPNGTNGSAYNQQLQATGGVPFAGGASPYSWSVVSGNLPANLNLATNGLLSGTLATFGTFSFTAQVMDAVGGINSQPLSLTVISTNPPPPLGIGTGSGQTLLFWPASAGTNFTLQMTTNLATGPWVTVTNAVPQVAFTVSNNAPAVFYRLH